MLNVNSLSFDYSDKALLQDLNFSVNAGCLLHLRGCNGSGKTTLLKLLAGLLTPIEGLINYAGHSIQDDLAAYKRHICYVGHKTGVSQLLTVRENCRFDLQGFRHGVSIDKLMQSFSLQGLEDIKCGLLSVGQRRRVGLLRLLMSDASLWLLDEPLVALDKEAMVHLMKWIDLHLARGGLIVLTSHQALPLKIENYQEYCL